MGLRAKGRVLGCRVFFDDHGLLALRIWGLGLEPPEVWGNRSEVHVRKMEYQYPPAYHVT